MKHPIKIYVTLSALMLNSAALLARGTDFGNGGDPIREVFNASRVFSGDLLRDITPKDSALASGSIDLQNAYAKYRTTLSQHIAKAEHQWGPNLELKRCLRPSTANADILMLSYEHCTNLAPTAVRAMPILLRGSLMAIADLRDYPTIDPLVDKLVTIWQYRNPAAAQRAAAFTVTRPSIGGVWSCEIGNKDFSIEIYPAGLVKGNIPQPTTYGEGIIKFSSFVTLTQDRTAFQAEGKLLLASAPTSSQYDNVIYQSTCDYSFQARLSRGLDSTELGIDLSSTGRPDLANRCPTLPAVRKVFTCQLQDSDD